MAGSLWGLMSIGEVLDAVDSINGGDASADVIALATAITEAPRISASLIDDFRDTGQLMNSTYTYPITDISVSMKTAGVAAGHRRLGTG